MSEMESIQALRATSPRQLLKSTQLFAALSDAELNSLAARAGMRSYVFGEMLFSEGSLAPAFLSWSPDASGFTRHPRAAGSRC